MLPWLAMEAANCINGLGEELLGGEKASCPAWAGNSKSLARSRWSGAALLLADLPELYDEEPLETVFCSLLFSIRNFFCRCCFRCCNSPGQRKTKAKLVHQHLSTPRQGLCRVCYQCFIPMTKIPFGNNVVLCVKHVLKEMAQGT